MPKVTGPLFSIAASGSLANAISYRKRPGYFQVEKKPVKRDLKSAAQLAHRSTFTSATSHWNSLSGASKAAYNALANPLRMTGYNYVIRSWLTGALP